jgi:hypothetical protein
LRRGINLEIADAWYWVMDWSDMLSVGNMTLILDKFFFPRWRQTLAMWLNHNPNYAEVTDWYTGWKNMLSDELLTQPTIKENFHNALEIMNRAVNIGQQPGAKESISYLSSMENNLPPPPPPPRVEVVLWRFLKNKFAIVGFAELRRRCSLHVENTTSLQGPGGEEVRRTRNFVRPDTQ